MIEMEPVRVPADANWPWDVNEAGPEGLEAALAVKHRYLCHFL
jgi:hypothetical protein